MSSGIYIVRADVPEIYCLDINITEPVEVLMKELESLYALPVEHQVILTFTGAVVSPTSRISQYGCGVEDAPFFLFSTQTTNDDAAADGNNADPLRQQEPHQPPFLEDFAAIDSAMESVSREFKKLSSRNVLTHQEYRNYIQEQRKLGELVRAEFSRAFYTFKAIEKLCYYQRVGLEAAWASIGVSIADIKRQMEDFLEKYKQQEVRHQELLNGFDTIISLLGAIQIRPALSASIQPDASTPATATAEAAPSAGSVLLDFVDVSECDRVKTQCEDVQKNFADKVNELKAVWNNCVVSHDSRFAFNQDFRVHLAEIDKHMNSETEMENFANLLKEDQSTLQYTKESNAKHLVNMVALFGRFYAVACNFRKYLDESARRNPVKTILSTISEVSVNLYFVRKQIPFYLETMQTKSNSFTQLRQVYLLPVSYGQLLVEIVFRHRFNVFYSKCRSAARDIFDAVCSVESQRRERFKESASFLQTPSTFSAGASLATSNLQSGGKAKFLLVRPLRVAGLDAGLATTELVAADDSEGLPSVSLQDVKTLRAEIEAFAKSAAVDFVLQSLDQLVGFYDSLTKAVEATCVSLQQIGAFHRKQFKTDDYSRANAGKMESSEAADVAATYKARIEDLEAQIKQLRKSGPSGPSGAQWESEKQELTEKHALERAETDEQQAKLRQTVAALEEQLLLVSSQLEQSENRRLEEVEALKRAAERNREEAELAVSKCALVANDLASARTAAEGLEKEVRFWRAEAESARDTLAKEMDAKALQLSALEARLAARERELHDELGSLTAALEAQGSELASRDSEIATLRDNARTRERELETQLEVLKASQAAQEKEAQRLAEATHLEIEALKTSLASQTANLAALRDSSASERALLARELQAKTEEVVAEKRRLESATSELATALQKQQTEREVFQQENSKLKTALQAQTVLQARVSAADDLKAQFCNALEVQDALKVENDTLKQAVAALQSQLDTCRGENEKLSSARDKEAEATQQVLATFVKAMEAVDGGIFNITAEFLKRFDGKDESRRVIKSFSAKHLPPNVLAELKSIEKTISKAMEEISRVHRQAQEKQQQQQQQPTTASQELEQSALELADLKSLKSLVNQHIPTLVQRLADLELELHISPSARKFSAPPADARDMLPRLDLSEIIESVRETMNQLSRITEASLNHEFEADLRKLSFLSLQVNDLVVFFPTKSQKWVAFVLENDRSVSKRYYLSEECVAQLKLSGDHFIGRVIGIEEKNKDGKVYYNVSATAFQ